MNWVRKLALYYLVAMAFMAWGIGIGYYHVFPYTTLKEVRDFIEGHKLGKKTTLLEKLMNDWEVVPTSFTWSYPESEHKKSSPIQVNGLKQRRDSPRVFMDSAHKSGYRAVFGALDFESSFWGGLLIGPQGQVLHTWNLSTNALKENTRSDENKNLYGLAMLADGSVIFTMQESGGGIVKIDACSNFIWGVDGEFHHAISPEEDGSFWTFKGRQEDFDPKLVKISIDTGEIQKIIDLKDVRDANPGIHIFNLQLDWSEKVIADATHGNDIEPLGSIMAEQFEMFVTGDLLISYRTSNLIFVIDPNTLKIKWWRIGPWDRQHDPDWEEDGKIVVFSNGVRWAKNGVSDIISIDPSSLSHNAIIKGEDFEFRSKINGRHQMTPFNSRIITSSTQGRVFEVDESNKIIFSFVNTYNDENLVALQMAESFHVKESYFKKKFWDECK